jgi:hypothetical protein
MVLVLVSDRLFFAFFLENEIGDGIWVGRDDCAEFWD